MSASPARLLAPVLLHRLIADSSSHLLCYRPQDELADRHVLRLREDVGDSAVDINVVQRRNRLHLGAGEELGARERGIDQTRFDEGHAHAAPDRFRAQGVAQPDRRLFADAVDRLAK